MPVRNFSAYVDAARAAKSSDVSSVRADIARLQQARCGSAAMTEVRRRISDLLKAAEEYEAADRRGEWWTRYHGNYDRHELERLSAELRRMGG